MRRFEYHQFTVETTGFVSSKLNKAFMNQLTELGKDGWEFIQALPLAQSYGKTGAVAFILKREMH